MTRYTSGVAHRPAHLYRCFSADGDLLYIGVSVDCDARFEAHDKGTPWWREVARVELTHFEKRYLAMQAEREAIVAENPRYNVRRNFRQQHVPLIVTTEAAS